MKIVIEIEQQYFEREDYYSREEFNALDKGFNKKLVKIKRKRDLNNHAYFLFMFAQFEDLIREKTKVLINNKRSTISNWKTRAIWDAVDVKNFHFMKMVGLHIDKNSGDYQLINEYYLLRNSIAHGKNVPGMVLYDMSTMFANMKRLFDEL